MIEKENHSQDSEQRIPKEKIWQGPIAWMVQNNVAANLLMWAMLVGGFIFLTNMKQEVFPPFEIDQVTITLELSGATPEEIEQGMVITVEDAVRNVENIDEVTAFVRSNGTATVYADAVEGADRDRFLQDIQNEVSRIRTFPNAAETPIVTLNKRVVEVMTIILSGSDDLLFLREWADIVKDELLLQPNISSVELDNTLDREIQIEVSQDTLRKYDLTLEEIASAIQTASIEQGAGTMETKNGDISIVVDDRRDYAHEFGQIAILSLEDGSRLLLEDIAIIKETFEDTKSFAHFNNHPAVLIDVYAIGEQTPAILAQESFEVIERLNQSLPAGLSLNIRKDFAEVFTDRADLLVGNAITGIILVFLCLALFLEPKLAVWVSIGIPIAIMGAFLFLNPYGSSINMMTMFAFILTLGIVVDDAIVVGENVHIWRRKGYSRPEAAVLGTKEINSPIVFSVLTNVVAFLPILFIPGFLGMMFAPIVPVVSAVFICSLVESLYVLPCHLAHDKKPRPGSFTFRISAYQRKFSHAFTKWVERVYGPRLDKILDYKYSVVAFCVGLLILSGAFIASGRLGIELMPKTESDFAYVEIAMPTDVSEDDLARLEKRLFEAATKVAEENGGDALSEGIYINYYGSTMRGYLYLVDADIRPLTTEEVTGLWQKEVGHVSGVESISFQSDKGGPGSGKALTVRLAHRDTEVLDTAIEMLAERIRVYSNVSDVDTGTSDKSKEYVVKITPLGEKLGFTSSMISSQLRSAFEGVTVLRQQRGRDEVTVRLRLPEEERADESTFMSLIVRSPSGEEVYLRDVVTIQEDLAPVIIRRSEGQRILEVSANVTPRSEASRILADINTNIIPELQAQFPGLSTVQAGMQKDIDDSMSSLYSGLLFVILAIYVLLAIPFKSYTQPFIIMIAIPFGIVGAIAGHVIMGYSLGVISVMGVLALAGLVVNDSLVLIDFANNARRAGKNARDAVHTAAIRRFRPILLTTLTTAIGLGPMIFETSRQAKMLIPVAISLGFGVLFATVITLALVPALYLILDENLNKLNKKKH